MSKVMEDQVNKLNSMIKVRLAPSRVHGIGMFAMRDLAIGQMLSGNVYPQLFNLQYSYFSKLFPDVRAILLERWPKITVGSNFFYPDALLQAYCNHSDDPNYDAKTDTLIRDVKAGEEIFEDYRKIPGWETVFPWLVNKNEEKSMKKAHKRLEKKSKV